MKRFFIILSFLFTASSSFSQNGWIRQQSGIVESLKSLYFINENTGWAAGDSGRILHTTNGGADWILQNSNTRKPLSKIVFMNATTGIAEGNYYVYNPWCQTGVISLMTTNAGSNWIVKSESHSSFYVTDLFADNNYCYASNAGTDISCIMSNGGISFTTNYGLTWSFMSPAATFGFEYFSVCFINGSLGWAAGQKSSDIGRKQYIFKTSNSGINWSIVFSDSLNLTSYSNLRFTNSDTGFALNRNGNYLEKSIDGGMNWYKVDSLNASHLNSYYFVNADTVWGTGGNGKIIRTNNGGMNWIYQNSWVTNSLSAVQFVNHDVGYIVGSDGLILKTGTGGLTSAGEFTTSVPSSYSLEQNFPNPFNPTTKIQFDIPVDSKVVLKIYDVTGREIRTLVNEIRKAGHYEESFNAVNLTSGAYICRISAGDFVKSIMMVLVQ